MANRIDNANANNNPLGRIQINENANANVQLPNNPLRRIQINQNENRENEDVNVYEENKQRPLENRIAYFPGPLPGQQKTGYEEFKVRSKEQVEGILKTGSIAKPTRLAGAEEKVLKYLHEYYTLNEGTQEFGEWSATLKEILQESKALIAGGSLLRALFKYPTPDKKSFRKDSSTDIDCYVSIQHLKQLNARLPRHLFHRIERMDETKSSTYCLSFLRRNGIRTVQCFLSDVEGYEIDVMAIRTSRSPLDVVTNFDLTFCQIWYDGKDVYATHPEHVAKQVGYLQNDYVPLYLAGNKFLQNRIYKYTRRGFQVFLDPTALESLTTLRLGDSKTMCASTNPAMQWCSPLRSNRRTTFFYQDYCIRGMMEYILTKGYIAKNFPNKPTSGPFWDRIQPGNQPRFALVPPALQQDYEDDGRRKDTTWSMTDGYDSEDYGALTDARPLWDASVPPTTPITFEKLFPLAKQHAALHSDDFAELDDKSVFYAMASAFYQLLMNPTEEKNPFFGMPIGMDVMRDTDLGLYFKKVKEALFETGDDLFGDTGRLFTFHAHQYPDGTATQESLETYLGDKKDVKDKYTVKCYGCPKYLTPEEIRPFVSHRFFKDYMTGGGDTPLSLRTTAFNLAETVLKNTKSRDPAYGDIFHWTFCPFCLEIVERQRGCEYLTHENEGGLDRSHAPYCNPKIQTRLYSEKYKPLLDDMNLLPDMPEEYRKLEFCVECGRPSLTHHHLSLTDPVEIVPHRVEGFEGYGTCDGGGRPELFARLLAIRRTILAHPEITDDLELRNLAAVEADTAPYDAELAQQGLELFQKALDERVWPNQEAVDAFIRDHPLRNTAAQNENENGKENEDSNVASEWSGPNNEGPPNNLPPLEHINNANQEGGRRRRSTHKRSKKAALARGTTHRRREKGRSK